MSEQKEDSADEQAGKSLDSAEPHDFDTLAAVLPDVIAAFRKVSPESQKRLLDTVATLFSLQPGSEAVVSGIYGRSSAPSFSEDRSMSPKEFLRQKQPRTDVERVACLAYYLTHYRDTPHFKTLDISQLNTDAAQIKFANAAKAVNNASSYGYLSATTKGSKQLTAAGESFVEALPDRDAAKQAIANARPRRRRKRNDKDERARVKDVDVNAQAV
jgi:hypothetical protein